MPWWQYCIDWSLFVIVLLVVTLLCRKVALKREKQIQDRGQATGVSPGDVLGLGGFLLFIIGSLTTWFEFFHN